MKLEMPEYELPEGYQLGHPLIGHRFNHKRWGTCVLAATREDGRALVYVYYKKFFREVNLSALSEENFMKSRMKKYAPDRSNKTATGMPSRTTGDNISRMLVGIDRTLLIEIGTENGFDMAEYDHVNTGIMRMILGNMIRSKVRRGEYVAILDEEVKSLDPGKLDTRPDGYSFISETPGKLTEK